jgi:hypothetical protein
MNKQPRKKGKKEKETAICRSGSVAILEEKKGKEKSSDKQ